VQVDRPDAALAIWRLDDDTTPEQLKAAWRELRTVLHPDRPSGDAGAFAAAERQHKLIKAWVERERPCKLCNGSGKIATPSRGGFHNLLMPCLLCGGVGKETST